MHANIHKTQKVDIKCKNLISELYIKDKEVASYCISMQLFKKYYVSILQTTNLSKLRSDEFPRKFVRLIQSTPNVIKLLKC